MDYEKRIRKLRELAGMTQAELGERAHMLQSQISMIENGVRGLNVKDADKIAAALGVTLNELLKEE